MTPQVVCPLPELADALQPYIRSREDITKIRHAVDSATLCDPHARRDRPVTRFRMLDGDASSLETNDPDTLGGIRAVHANALAAYKHAQSRMSVLRAEIANVQAGNGEPDAGYRTAGLDVILSIRREQRLRRLQIVQSSIEALEAEQQQSQYATTGEKSSNELPQAVALPAVASQSHARDEVQSKVIELKKAVLSAERLTASNAVNPSDIGSSSPPDGPSKSRHLLALSRARDNIIIWLEGELAKIPDVSEETSTPHQVDASADKVGAQGAELTTEEHILLKYQEYIEARKRLVELMSISKNERTVEESSAPPERPASTQIRGTDQPSGLLAMIVLPYCKELSDITEVEAGLVQESAFVRRQLAWSSEKTRQLIHRLADESHLVTPGVSAAKDWVQAGEAVREADAELINSKLLAGEASLRRAREA